MQVSELEVAPDPASNLSGTTGAAAGLQMEEEGKTASTVGVQAAHAVQRPEEFGISSERLAEYMQHLARSLV